jgi:hypothetical protein
MPILRGMQVESNRAEVIVFTFSMSAAGSEVTGNTKLLRHDVACLDELLDIFGGGEALAEVKQPHGGVPEPHLRAAGSFFPVGRCCSRAYPDDLSVDGQ